MKKILFNFSFFYFIYYNILFLTMANLNEILKMDKKTNELGIYKLTPVEAFLINKNLPYGTKFILESEYNRKYLYNSSNKKKSLLNQKINRTSNEIISNKEIKQNQNDDNIEIKKIKDNYIKLIYKGKTHLNSNFIIRCKCLIFLYQFSRKFELEPIFIYNNPSIRDIENNVIKRKYDSFYQFKLSIRKFWLYCFQKEKNKINQIKKLCKFSEEEFNNIDKLNEETIIKIYNSLSIDESISLFQVKTNSSNLKIESNSCFNIQKQGKIPLISPIIKDNSFTTNESLLNEEKNLLCEKIKSLNSIQLQGIIPLLSDFFTDINNITDKYVEFDIELLNKEQTEKVEKYVDKCIEYNNNYNIDKINNNNIKIIDNYNNNINDNNNNVDNKLKNKRKILLETPSSKNLNSINNEDIKKNIEITNDDENDDNNLNLKYNEGNNIPNNIKSNKENYKKNNTYNYNNNDNNIIFTENSILNQNKSLEQSKIETTSLFNPLVVSDKNFTNSQNLSLNYLVNKSSPNLSQKSNQLNYDSESFDYH